MDELIKDLKRLLENWQYHADTMVGDDHPQNQAEGNAYLDAIEDVKEVIDRCKKETS